MEELNKRVEQGKTIDDIVRLHCKTHECCMNSDKSEMVMEVLDCKYADIIKNIEWVGECDVCSGDGYTVEHNHMGCNCGEQQEGPSTCPVQVQCEKCQATGQYARPATLEECLEVFPRVLNLDDEQIPSAYTNNGALRVK